MSASLIAATTQALKARLETVLPVATVITFQSLAQAESFPPSPRVNLFLHRLGEAPGANPSPLHARAPFHFELKYLITAYSPVETPAATDPCVLLESVLRAIDLNPVIAVPRVLSARLMMEILPLSDLTGLFLSARAAYRPSLALVVRVADEAPAPVSPPVVQRSGRALKIKAVKP